MVTMDVVLLLLRVVAGLIFLGHGLQKLTGWFGGEGLAGTGTWLNSLGFTPGRFWAALAGLLETLGGLGLALGLFTTISALAVIAVQLAAILAVHAPKGFWISSGGYEYNIVLITVAVALALAGPGAWALDTIYNLPALTQDQFGIGLLVVLVAAALVSIWSWRGRARARLAR